MDHQSALADPPAGQPETAAGVPAAARRIYNSAVVTFAAAAAIDLGLFDAVRGASTVDLDQFILDRDLHPGTVRGIVSTLAAADLVVSGPGHTRVAAGPGFDGMDAARPFVLWLVRGNGSLLASLAARARNERPPDSAGRDEWGRDMTAVARSASIASELYFDPVLEEALREVEFTTAVDLGCGDGARLAKLARARPAMSGVGVDISPVAVRAARQRAAQAGVADRLRFRRDDVTSLTPDPECDRADLLMCFLMGHDLWPRPGAVRTLSRLRQVFPHARNFILCDECRPPEPLSLDNTVFTLGFMLVHAAMEKTIPTIEQWQGVFADSGWRCVRTLRSGVPESNVLFHLQPS
ncbi:MAG: methyltransferase domain-containing protein [Natronosporangium sp.]